MCASSKMCQRPDPPDRDKVAPPKNNHALRGSGDKGSFVWDHVHQVVCADVFRDPLQERGEERPRGAGVGLLPVNLDGGDGGDAGKPAGVVRGVATFRTVVVCAHSRRSQSVFERVVARGRLVFLHEAGVALEGVTGVGVVQIPGAAPVAEGTKGAMTENGVADAAAVQAREGPERPEPALWRSLRMASKASATSSALSNINLPAGA